jgi:hypothetical protein
MVPVKSCSRCHQQLPLTAFYADRTKPDGRGSQCTPCFRTGHGLAPEGRRYRHDPASSSEKLCSGCDRLLPVSSFGRNRKKQDGHQTYCRQCTANRNLRFREQDPDGYRRRGREKYQRHREKHRLTRLRRRGLAEETFLSLLEIQGGLCAICGAKNGSVFVDRLFVDHDHETGEIRGLLCSGCNAGRLGTAGDSVERLSVLADGLEERARFARRAIEYLTNPPARSLRLGVSDREPV